MHHLDTLRMCWRAIINCEHETELTQKLLDPQGFQIGFLFEPCDAVPVQLPEFKNSIRAVRLKFKK
jgi:hypothetical protein